MIVFPPRLQKFKMTIANTVISADNASLTTMGTDQLLDLFTLDEGSKGSSAAPGSSRSGTGGGGDRREGIKAILEGLGELWDEAQYESEYDINTFMKSLA